MAAYKTFGVTFPATPGLPIQAHVSLVDLEQARVDLTTATTQSGILTTDIVLEATVTAPMVAAVVALAAAVAALAVDLGTEDSDILVAGKTGTGITRSSLQQALQVIGSGLLTDPSVGSLV